jgi:hypothetical protein
MSEPSGGSSVLEIPARRVVRTSLQIIIVLNQLIRVELRHGFQGGALSRR